MSGIKFDQDKDPWHLAPWDAFKAIIKVLKYGANKYTTKFENKWEGLWSVVGAKKLSLYTPLGNVVHVTKNNSEKIILNLQSDKGRTGENGVRETQIILKNWAGIEDQIQNLLPEIKELSGFAVLKKSDCQKNSTITMSKKDALSAVQPNSFTLITTIQRGNTEGYCVVNTTTDWDFLETTLKVLRKPLNISELSSLSEISGKRNWEQGMDWSRLYSALMRHLVDWWEREDNGVDPETGYSHLWHVGCCVIFLIAYEIRGVGKDDRPRLPPRLVPGQIIFADSIRYPKPK